MFSYINPSPPKKQYLLFVIHALKRSQFSSVQSLSCVQLLATS